MIKGRADWLKKEIAAHTEMAERLRDPNRDWALKGKDAQEGRLKIANSHEDMAEGHRCELNNLMKRVPKSKRQCLNLLRKAILTLTGVADEQDIEVLKLDGQWLLCWEGIFEWTIAVSGGDSIFSGSTGHYGHPQEEAIADVCELVKLGGFYFEPQNNCQMAVGE